MTFQKKNNVSAWYDVLSDPSKVDPKQPQKTFNTDDIQAQCKIINDLINTEIDKFEDKDPSRVFLNGPGMGGNMVNACLFSYKNAKPLGGVIAFNSMIPYTYAQITSQD